MADVGASTRATQEARSVGGQARRGVNSSLRFRHRSRHLDESMPTHGSGGGGGIRTHGGLPLTRFPSVPIRPLSHPSWSGGQASPSRARRDARQPIGSAIVPLSEVTVGSCATGSRESGQDREVAAFNGVACVPQVAWPSPQSAGRSAPVINDEPGRLPGPWPWSTDRAPPAAWPTPRTPGSDPSSASRPPCPPRRLARWWRSA